MVRLVFLARRWMTGSLCVRPKVMCVLLVLWVALAKVFLMQCGSRSSHCIIKKRLWGRCERPGKANAASV